MRTTRKRKSNLIHYYLIIITTTSTTQHLFIRLLDYSTRRSIQPNTTSTYTALLITDEHIDTTYKYYTVNTP